VSTPLCACGCGSILKVALYPSHQAKWVRGHAPQPTMQLAGAIARFWARVEKTQACWNWRGSVRHFGHGHLNVLGVVTMAHRFSWTLTNGSIPDGLNVLHHCDNPRCVRPDHLFLGTHADNVADMNAKGRHARGERHGRAKLTDAQRAEAVAAYDHPGRRDGSLRRLRTVLAERFNVKVSTIAKAQWDGGSR
jgi:hypothetical protein